jgi:hypothetical protein
MLSTRLGYGRPAFLAERLARTFCAGESLREPPFFFFLGFGLRHGACLAAIFFLAVGPADTNTRSLTASESNAHFILVFPEPCPRRSVPALRPLNALRPSVGQAPKTVRRDATPECGFTPADIRHENGEDARNRWLSPGIASGGGASWP